MRLSGQSAGWLTIFFFFFFFSAPQPSGWLTILQWYSHLKGKGILTVLYASVGYMLMMGSETVCSSQQGGKTILQWYTWRGRGFWLCYMLVWASLVAPNVKNLPAMWERDLGLIPGSRRSPGGGHGTPLHYSCLENPHRQRSLAGYSPWGRKESDTTEQAQYIC